MVSTPSIGGNAMAAAYQGEKSGPPVQEVRVNEVQPRAAPPPTSNSSNEQRGGSGEGSSGSGDRGRYFDKSA